MKTSFLLFIISLFTAARLSAQFKLKQAHLGGTGYDADPTLSVAKDGSVYMGGTSNSNKSGNKSQDSRGGNDYWVIKGVGDNATGTVKKMWDKTIGGSGGESFGAIVATPDNGCLLAGSSGSGISGDKTDTASGNGNDTWLVKLDKNGNIQWQNTIEAVVTGYPYTLITGADQLPDGGFILSKGLDGLIRTDAVGKLLWKKPSVVFGLEYDVEYTSVKRTTDGGYIIAANGELFGGIWLIKTDSSGVMQWNFSIPGSLEGDGTTYSRAVPKAIQTMDGGYAIYYSFAVEADDYSYDIDRYLYKTDRNGKQLWFIHDNTRTVYQNACLAQTKDGQYLFGSTIGYPSFSLNLEKIDEHGNKLWEDTVPCNGSSFDMVRVGANSYLLSGNEWMKANTDSANNDYYAAAITDTSNSAPVAQQAVTNNMIVSKLPQKFTVYPNPVKDRLFIQNAGTANFIITDENGKTVLTKNITGNEEIDVSVLTSGVYYLKNTSTGTSQKIVIIK